MTDTAPNVVPLEPRHRTRLNPRLSAALSLAARGWHVFRIWPHENGRCSCPPRCDKAGKHPKGSWGTEATTEPDVIRRWWNEQPTPNIGVATGLRSGLVVLDVDGEEGRETLAGLEEEHGTLPTTPQVRTGRKGARLVSC